MPRSRAITGALTMFTNASCGESSQVSQSSFEAMQYFETRSDPFVPRDIVGSETPQEGSMQPVLHAPSRTSRLETSAETWGEMCWLMEDRLVPDARVSVARMTINSGSGSPSHLHPNCNEMI